MWQFVKSATNQANYFNSHALEVCFIGRSNVGKSSLINALAHRKIAKTSRTPGRTRLINFFRDKNQCLVDLPGYGYAKMARHEQNKILAMIEDYLQGRTKLKRIFVLIDAKVGPTPDDILLLDFLKVHAKHFFVVLTKCDRANQAQLHHTKKKVHQITPDYLIVSARTGHNITQLKKIINATFKASSY